MKPNQYQSIYNEFKSSEAEKGEDGGQVFETSGLFADIAGLDGEDKGEANQ